MLDFHEKNGAWPRMGSAEDAKEVLAIAEAISESRKDIDGAIWAQTFKEVRVMRSRVEGGGRQAWQLLNSTHPHLRHQRR